MNKKEEVLQKIRDACPELKDCTTGCVIKLDSGHERVFLSKGDGTSYWIISSSGTPARMTGWGQGHEIIGHPPQFNHLLQVMDDSCKGDTERIKKYLIEIYDAYDLTKSVDENLNNPELLDFLHTLLITK